VLLETQRAFARALLAGEGDAALALLAPSRLPPGRRLAVHVNTVLGGLVGSLAAAHPAVQAVLGEQGFRALAGAFARRHPPRSARLSAYGAGFADFLDAAEAAAERPWLPDLARLEWARNEALFAADAAVLAPEALAGLPAGAVPELRLAVHPAARLLRASYPVAALRARALGEPLPEGGSAAVLVTRPAWSVLQAPLGSGAAAFLTALFAAESFAEAAAAGLAADPDLALESAFALALRQGAFSRVIPSIEGEAT